MGMERYNLQSCFIEYSKEDKDIWINVQLGNVESYQ